MTINHKDTKEVAEENIEKPIDPLMGEPVEEVAG
jgi:hypothetical protein